MVFKKNYNFKKKDKVKGISLMKLFIFFLLISIVQVFTVVFTDDFPTGLFHRIYY